MPLTRRRTANTRFNDQVINGLAALLRALLAGLRRAPREAWMVTAG